MLFNYDFRQILRYRKTFRNILNKFNNLLYKIARIFWLIMSESVSTIKGCYAEMNVYTINSFSVKFVALRNENFLT